MRASPLSALFPHFADNGLRREHGLFINCEGEGLCMTSIVVTELHNQEAEDAANTCFPPNFIILLFCERTSWRQKRDRIHFSFKRC